MKKITLIIFILITFLCSFNISYADNSQEINNLKSQIYNADAINGSKLTTVGANIAWYISWVAIIASVIVLMLKGIKFITSAPEGKAEVKKELMPWAIGLVILFSMNVVLNFIIDFAQNNINNLTI